MKRAALLASFLLSAPAWGQISNFPSDGRCGANPNFEEPLYQSMCSAGPNGVIYAGIIRGEIASDSLGSGDPDNTKFLRGDRIWAVPPAGSGGGGISLSQLTSGLATRATPADVDARIQDQVGEEEAALVEVVRQHAVAEACLGTDIIRTISSADATNWEVEVVSDVQLAAATGYSLRIDGYAPMFVLGDTLRKLTASTPPTRFNTGAEGDRWKSYPLRDAEGALTDARVRIGRTTGENPLLAFGTARSYTFNVCALSARSSGISQAQLEAAVNPLDSRLDDVEELDAALRQNTAIATNVFLTATDRNTWYSISGAKFPTPDGGDHEIGYTIIPAGEDPITGSFNLSTLRGHEAVVADGRAVNVSDALRIRVGDDSYYIGRDTSEDAFFGTSEAGIRYSLSFTDERIDTTPFLRGVIPTEHLGTGTADTTTFLRGDGSYAVPPTGGGGGLTTQQATALIAVPARAGNTDRWSINKLPAASRTASGTISNNDYAKLEGIESGATADQTGPEMVAALSGLTGTARLPASAVRDLPAYTDTDTQRTDAEIQALAEAEVAPFARTGVLLRTNVQKHQDILDAFLDGGWVAAAGPASTPTTAPYVGSEVQNTQWDATTILTGSFTRFRVIGLHYATAYIKVRIPKVYAEPLDILRLRIGENAYDPDSLSYTFAPLDGQNVLKVTSDGTYDYYSVGPIDKPAGSGFGVELLTKFSLDRNHIGGDELVPDGGSPRQYITRTVGDGPLSWADLPHVPGARLVFSQLGNLIAPQALDDRYGSPSYFTDLDLDDANKASGSITVTATIRLTAATTGNTANLSFTRQDAETTKDRERTITVIPFLSQIRAATAYSNPTNPHGIELIELPIYNANTHAATYWIRLIKDSNNNAGLYQWYDGIAGTEGPVTVNSAINATFTPDDALSSDPAGVIVEKDSTSVVSAATKLNFTGAGVAVADGGSGEATITIGGGSGGGGLDASGVRGQVQSQLRQGNNITITPSGSGASRLLTIAAQQRSTASIRAELESSLTAGTGIVLTPSGSGATRSIAISSPHNYKEVSFEAASATANRKTVTSDASAVVLSDWEDLDLVADATAVGGMTVADDAIVFANAGLVDIQFGMTFTTDTGGGGSRNYVHLRGQLTRASVTSEPKHMKCGTYNKTAADAANLMQGPDEMLVDCDFKYLVQAGDQIKLQWRGYLQTNTQIDVEADTSGIAMEIR